LISACMTCLPIDTEQRRGYGRLPDKLLARKASG
jgi:hypothetical protein